VKSKIICFPMILALHERKRFLRSCSVKSFAQQNVELFDSTKRLVGWNLI
jgi:hypothetical protein